MVDYNAVKNWRFGEVKHSYSERDTMLYALAVGYGSDPVDERQLRFVYEPELQAAPTLAAVLGTPGSWMRNPATGADWVKTLFGEHDLRVLRPLPAAGTVIGRSRVVALADKGPGKGALIEVERDILDAADGAVLARARSIEFMRGDGGFSHEGGASDPLPVLLPALEPAGPAIEIELPTLPQSALLYRLTGDYNPLHADPKVARAAGFARPILHGLCTYGMAAHAVLRACCDYDAARLKRMAVRFTAPVVPGDVVRFSLWRDGPQVRLRGRVEARGVTVIDRGLFEIA